MFERSRAWLADSARSSSLCPAQSSAGARALLRLPGLLRFVLLLWLVYQSSELRAAGAGGRCSMTLVACTLPAPPLIEPVLTCLPASPLLSAAAVPVVVRLRPEAVWPLGRWMAVGAGEGGVWLECTCSQPHWHPLSPT